MKLLQLLEDKTHMNSSYRKWTTTGKTNFTYRGCRRFSNSPEHATLTSGNIHAASSKGGKAILHQLKNRGCQSSASQLNVFWILTYILWFLSIVWNVNCGGTSIDTHTLSEVKCRELKLNYLPWQNSVR